MENSNNCIYCTAPFGAKILYKRKIRILHRVKDHFYPRSAGGKGGKNLVWCCQVCNSIKYDLVFETIMVAQNYILDKLLKSDWQIIEDVNPI